MNLDDMLALLPDNTTGAIGADDMRAIVTGLWEYTQDVQTALNAGAVETGQAITEIDGALTDLDARTTLAVNGLDARVTALEEA